MDNVELDLSRREAGTAYLAAIEKLGLRPDALFWTFDTREHRFILVLVTDLFDFKGPLPIAQLLFRAYNACATPKEIDPFIVRLHSPRHAHIKKLAEFGPGAAFKLVDPAPGRSNEPTFVEGVQVDGVNFRHAWVYRFKMPPERKSVDLARRWHRVERSVGKLAA